MAELDIQNWTLIGKNDLGYEFFVGSIAHKWIGFAVGAQTVSLFSQIADRDYELGLTDKARVILLTGAIAQDDESGYGGITEWFVPENQRGDPEKLRCKHCCELVCEGDCEAAEEDELYGDDDQEDIEDEDEVSYDLGPCCICEGTEGVHNIIMLEKKAPEGPGGWGCLQCGLPSEGASAVLCEPCFGKFRAKEVSLRFAVKGYIKEKGRIPFAELTGEHKHDPSKHPELEDEENY